MRLRWWHAIMQKRKTKFFKVLIIGVGWSWSVTELLMRNVAWSLQWKSSTNLFTLCFVSIDSFLVTSIVTSFYLFLYFKQLKRETNSFFCDIYLFKWHAEKNIQTCWKNYWQWCRVFNWYNRAVNFIWKNINVAIKRKKMWTSQ